MIDWIVNLVTVIWNVTGHFVWYYGFDSFLFIMSCAVAFYFMLKFLGNMFDWRDLVNRAGYGAYTTKECAKETLAWGLAFLLTPLLGFAAAILTYAGFIAVVVGTLFVLYKLVVWIPREMYKTFTAPNYNPSRVKEPVPELDPETGEPLDLKCQKGHDSLSSKYADYLMPPGWHRY